MFSPESEIFVWIKKKKKKKTFLWKVWINALKGKKCFFFCDEPKSAWPQGVKEFNKTIIPFALAGYETGYSQLGATRLVGYLPSHIQRALME